MMKHLMKYNIIANLKKQISIHPLFLPLIINLFFLVVSLVLFHPHFEEVDDQYMAFIAEGVYGSRSAILVFSNYIYGCILYFLYSIYAGIRWYSVLQIVFLFISFTIITHILIQTSGRRIGTLLSLCMLLCFSYEGYVSIQFTKTSGYMVVAGYLLLFHLGKSKPCHRTVGILLGIFFTIVGALIREDSFWMVSLIMLGIGLYELYQIYRSTERILFFKAMTQYAIPFCIIIIAVLGASFFTIMEINSSLPGMNTRLTTIFAVNWSTIIS